MHYKDNTRLTLRCSNCPSTRSKLSSQISSFLIRLSIDISQSNMSSMPVWYSRHNCSKRSRRGRSPRVSWRRARHLSRNWFKEAWTLAFPTTRQNIQKRRCYIFRSYLIKERINIMFYWYSKARVRNRTSHEQNQIIVNTYWMKFRLILLTLTETLIIRPDITKTESNNYFIIQCFEENNDKHTIA